MKEKEEEEEEEEGGRDMKKQRRERVGMQCHPVCSPVEAHACMQTSNRGAKHMCIHMCSLSPPPSLSLSYLSLSHILCVSLLCLSVSVSLGASLCLATIFFL